MISLRPFYSKFLLALVILWIEALLLSSSAGVTGVTTGSTRVTQVMTTAGRHPNAPQPAGHSRLRLNNGSSIFEGRAEIFHDGQWGTICDDDADTNACIVICRQLGLSGGQCMNEDGGIGCQAGATVTFGQGDGPIWVDDLQCTGMESILDECLKSNWGVTNCHHKEDFACFCDPGGDGSAVRLVNGSHPNEGRVEVYHNRTWGTVCDDDASDNACRVICRQLNLMGGKCVNENGAYGCESGSTVRFGLGTGVIWIDELTCTGGENSVGECQKNNWGDVNCIHKEDLSCICSNQSSSSYTPGQCDPNRHRLRATDPTMPGIGRVEVKDPVTDQWGVVCDDSWNDLDAAVFCLCLGFTDQTYFHSLFNQPLLNASLPLLFDAVHCLPDNVANRTSLFDCPTEPVTPGRCDVELEAAHVACTAFPNITQPEAPAPVVACQGTMLSACFQLTNETGRDESHFHLHPNCSAADVNITSDLICYNVDITACPSAASPSTNTTKPYCYDISYSAFDQSPETLITDHTWSTRVCCAISRNASAVASFRPVIDLTSKDTSVRLSDADQRKIVNYTVKCFTETDFGGVPLDFPAVVYRGMELFCKVAANTWDRNLFLVVTDCHFLTSLNADADNSAYYFIKNKCITPLGKNIGLRLHSIDNSNWGFRFQMPKFQGFDMLYLSCATSVCDKRRDAKPDCDRSCTTHHRTRRHVRDDPSGSKRPRSAGKQQVLRLDRDATDVGPFLVWDFGQGYVISEDGDVLVYSNSSEVLAKADIASSSVNHRHYTFMTQSTLVHIYVVFCLFLSD